MNSQTKELSYLSKHPFESEEIIREFLPESKDTSSMWFYDKQEHLKIKERQFIDRGEEEVRKEMERQIGTKISLSQRKNMFRYIFERENYDELIDLKKDFSIKLFKELSIGSKSLRVDKDVFKILDKQRQIIKDSDWIHSRIIMRPGDIEIILKKSLELSTSVKKFEIPRKSVPRVIVKGENCFLQTKTPDGFLADDLLTIELATQEDIKNVFELMNKIL